MASYNNVDTISLDAGADLSSSQYRFVKVGTVDGTVVVCGDGENGIGVLINDPIAGQAAAIATSGAVKVQAGGNVTRGGRGASSATGLAVTATSGDYVLGTFLENGVNGQIVEFKFDKNGIEPA